MMPALVEDHHLVLFRPSAELLATALREALYKHIELLALVFLVLNGTHLRLQLDQFIQTTDLLFLRHIIGQVLRGVGARAF